MLVYLALCHLGAHRSTGWPGSHSEAAGHARRAGARNGHPRLHDGVKALERAGLLERQVGIGVDSVFRLVCSESATPSEVCSESPTPNREVCSVSPTGCCQNAHEVCSESPTLSTLGEEEKGGEGITPLSPPMAADLCACAPDVCIEPIPVRNGQPCPAASWPADGLADEVRAAGLKLSDVRVENLVRRSDAAEVRRQLGWWERRRKLWGDWKPRSPERIFESHCENRDLEPDDKPARQTSPASKSVAEAVHLPPPEDCCSPAEWNRMHPENPIPGSLSSLLGGRK